MNITLEKEITHRLEDYEYPALGFVGEAELVAKGRIHSWEENYGEDADGNRGVWTRFDEVEEISCKVNIYDPDSKELVNSHEVDFESLSEREQITVEQLLVDAVQDEGYPDADSEPEYRD